MSNLVKINNQELKVKEFNGQRIVTFKDIDALHERVDGTARRNFNDNKLNKDGSDRFVEGIDYFIRNSYEAKSEFGIIAPNGLTLITESGYLMLVKSLTDDLAWKVQRELVNNYFRVKEQKQLSPMEQLRLQYQALEMQEKKIEGVAKKVDDLEANMPLFNVECKELQNLVRRVGTKVLGGYKSPAYCNNSLRGKVYSDIQHQLRREFGIERYEAIKRSQLDTAKKIVESYKAPLVLVNEIDLINSQLSFSEEAV